MATRFQQLAAMRERAAAAAAAANQPAVQPQIVIMEEARADNFPVQLAVKLDHEIVHAVLFGLAGAGKSTAFNFINYVLYGSKFIGGRATGEAAVAGGQFSTQCVREEASFYLKWDVKQKGDLLLTDTVGFKGDESEISAIGNGKLKEIEAWPRDNSEASNRKRVEILNRPPQTTRPTCFVLFISADQLMNKNDKANDAIVHSVIEAAKTKFTAGKYQVEIPIMVVITKVDKMESNPTKEDLLHQRTSPKLNGIFKACHERFGVAQDDIFALGFMDETDLTDFSSATTDPRVLTVRHLLLKIAEGARLCAKRFRTFDDQVAAVARNAEQARMDERQKQSQSSDRSSQQFPASTNQSSLFIIAGGVVTGIAIGLSIMYFLRPKPKDIVPSIVIAKTADESPFGSAVNHLRQKIISWSKQ